jgi:hypothetical protein
MQLMQRQRKSILMRQLVSPKFIKMQIICFVEDIQNIHQLISLIDCHENIHNYARHYNMKMNIDNYFIPVPASIFLP